MPVREVIREILAADDRLKVDFFCGLYLHDPNEGLALTPRTLAEIAILGAELGLDMYWEGDEAETSSEAS